MKKLTVLSFAVFAALLFGISGRVDACGRICKEVEKEVKKRVENYLKKFGQECFNDCKDTITSGARNVEICINTKCKKDAGQDAEGEVGL